MTGCAGFRKRSTDISSLGLCQGKAATKKLGIARQEMITAPASRQTPTIPEAGLHDNTFTNYTIIQYETDKGLWANARAIVIWRAEKPYVAPANTNETRSRFEYQCGAIRCRRLGYAMYRRSLMLAPSCSPQRVPMRPRRSLPTTKRQCGRATSGRSGNYRNRAGPVTRAPDP
jgi:hypothetical protein